VSITIIGNLSPTWYTPEDQQGQDDPVEFKLKPLSGLERLEVSGETRTDSNGELILTAKGLILAVRYGLIGWRRVLDEQGREIKFNTQAIGKLSPELLAELSGVILERSTLGGEEKKD
jgi:hypothetical protein